MLTRLTTQVENNGLRVDWTRLSRGSDHSLLPHFIPLLCMRQRDSVLAVYVFEENSLLLL